MKPIIGVDIDGVLCDFNSSFVALLNEHHGLNLSHEHQTEFKHEECLSVTKKQVSKTWRDGCTPEWFGGLAPIEGAVNALNEIWDVANIWLITARTPRYYEATHYWLKQHGIPHDALIATKNKLEFAPFLKCMIEDKYSAAREFADADVPTIVMDAPHNRKEDAPLIYRAKNWDEVLGIVRFIL